MRQIAVIIVAALIAGAAGYILKSNPASTGSVDSNADTATLSAKVASLNKQLKQAQAKAGRVEVIETKIEVPFAPTLPSAESIIEKLTKLDASDKRTLRRAVYYLETLVDQGDAAIPAIRKFMDKDVDLDISESLSGRRSVKAQFNKKGKIKDTKEAAGKKGPKKSEDPDKTIRKASAWNYFRPFPRTNTDYPATLRLGLLEATHNIGTEQAEALLLDILEATARGVEVAYLELSLQELSPGEHLDKILKAARDILADMPALGEDAMEVDLQTKGYLYAILVKYKDLDFVETAKGLLIRPDGSLDGHALSYLRQVLGSDAIPILQTAINDNRVTDGVAKYAVRDAALHYVGQNAQANQILMDVVREGLDKQVEGEKFNWGELKLSYTSLMRDVETQSDQVLTNRRQLIQYIREEFNHPDLNQGLDKMDHSLGRTLEGRQESEK
jgi:hypothetical protein|tara:strand:+ start:571 stop:1899 length:1329 start_codon:yes stop_codon:yes gene_type:complete